MSNIGAATLGKAGAKDLPGSNPGGGKYRHKAGALLAPVLPNTYT